MRIKRFTKLRNIGNGFGVYLNKHALNHLRVYKDSDICLTFNKNGTITLSKAKYSDRLIEDIICQMDLVNLDNTQ